jgi:hypothetical protein
VQVERIEIGLSIKLEGRGLYIPGYARRADRGWDYSELTKQIFAEYKREFPEVLAYLAEHADAPSIDSAAMFGAERHVQRVEQISRWLKRQPTAKIPLMPLTVRPPFRIAPEYHSSTLEHRKITASAKPTATTPPKRRTVRSCAPMQPPLGPNASALTIDALRMVRVTSTRAWSIRGGATVDR